MGWELYCNLRLLGYGVLQHGAVGLQVFVSQSTKCIVTEEAWVGGACHNTLRGIVTGEGLSGWETVSRYNDCIVTEVEARQARD